MTVNITEPDGKLMLVVALRPMHGKALLRAHAGNSNELFPRAGRWPSDSNRRIQSWPRPDVLNPPPIRSPLEDEHRSRRFAHSGGCLNQRIARS